MILKKLEYSEFQNSIGEWVLNEFTLENINLFVGKNATGKSRTIQTISNIGQVLLTGIPYYYPHTTYCSIELYDSSDVYHYTLEIKDYNILNECLQINQDVRIKRGKDGIGQIFACKENKMIDFQILNNQPAIAFRQDAIQYPYLEKIINWAEGLRVYAFGGTLGKELGLPLDFNEKDAINHRITNQAVGLYIKGIAEFGDEFESQVLTKMNMLGYILNRIWVQPYLPFFYKQDVQMICVMENDREDILAQTKMSQGIFRALSLVIQITYNILRKSPTTILIDDIGEGLDFDRSTKLISLLIEIAENNNIQLIMSTNDRYVMNKVPFKYWQVIDRKGGVCKVFNYNNSKSIFEDFTYTGLNNFDFLAYDYINSKWETV
ncbi:hypothetical protein FACS189485_03000 [Spirochaetia bacterium]|nr:hypothetical protein FACS189485_03000 [Spirochaetia bacterium]